MKFNEKGIMGACDYTISTLQDVKQKLIFARGKDKNHVWPPLGLILTLVGYLLSTSVQVINESTQSETPDAKNDILEIQQKFNEFVNQMLSND